MKGTLISFDFVRDSGDSIKFIEMNTDVMMGDGLTSHLDWSGLWTVMSDNSITELDVVYKPNIQQDIVDHLSASAATNGITAFRHHKEEKDSIYPNTPDDTGSAFILRLAYDENAIVDSTYCKLGHTSLNLLHEYNSGSLTVPYYYSGSDSDTIIDTLSAATGSENSNRVPDAVTKTKVHQTQGIHFHKVGYGQNSWNNLIEDHKEDNYILKYEYASASLANGIAESLKQYTIAYGADLTPIDVATFKLYAKFSYPTGSLTLVVSSSIENGIVTEFPELPKVEDPTRWANTTYPVSRYYEFGTARPKLNTSQGYGLYETEKIVLDNGNSGSLFTLTSGSGVRSLHIPGFTGTSTWVHNGKTLPAGTVYTSSIAEADSIESSDSSGIICSITVDGGDPTYVSPSLNLLSYESSSNSFGYFRAYELSSTNHYIPGNDGTLLPIVSETLMLFKPTGSYSTADVEAVDNFQVYTSDSNVRLISHNFDPEELGESPGKGGLPQE